MGELNACVASPRTSFCIREASDKDLLVVLSLLRELSPEDAPNPEEQYASWQRMHQYPYYKLFVATRRARVVGTFCLLIADNLGHGGSRFAILENFVVAPTCQRQGLGTLMLQRAMELARKQGCYKIMLSSAMHRSQAHEFYLRAGFGLHGLSFMTKLDKECPTLW
ncbi:MAG: Aminoalkylphosphonate N-acetyltransferase [Firmicutes bacterium]|nr:Aminoalkylphosphonate N-acetyltransferase [candidate division NPL-UPA2 bacterium]